MQKKPIGYFYLNKTPFGIAKKREMTLSTKIILQEADRLNISWEVIPGTELIALSFNNHIEYFTTQIPGTTSALAYLLTNDKSATKHLLDRHGIRTPQGDILTKKSSLTYHIKLFNFLKKPLVVKPLDTAHGNHVYLDIRDVKTFTQKVKTILSKYQSVVVEEMLAGKEYRFIVSREKVIAITYRVPANIVGDGYKTIEQLVEDKNSDPRRGNNFKNHALLKITIDIESLRLIRKQGYSSLQDIPIMGKQVLIRETSNISTGGDSIDFTNQAHESMKNIAVKAINAIPGLAFAGIDIMTNDITKSQTNNSYGVIEINGSPGIFPQYMPYLGKSQPTPLEFLKVLFPELCRM